MINAAEYGAAQRRRRTFIFAYNKDTEYAKSVDSFDAEQIITEKGLMARAFPIEEYKGREAGSIKYSDITKVDVDTLLSVGTAESDNDLIEMTQHYKFPFSNAGYMIDGEVLTMNVSPREIESIKLNEIVQSNVAEEYYIKQEDMGAWSYMKGAKKIPRTSANGHEYIFSEGPIAFPDPLDRPGRTMLTSESTKNRSTHVVADKGTGRLRLLTEIETERLQGFDDDWTKTCLVDGKEVDMPKRMRYFCMGNALVVPMITRMGSILDQIIENE